MWQYIVSDISQNRVPSAKSFLKIVSTFSPCRWQATFRFDVSDKVMSAIEACRCRMGERINDLVHTDQTMFGCAWDHTIINWRRLLRTLASNQVSQRQSLNNNHQHNIIDKHFCTKHPVPAKPNPKGWSELISRKCLWRPVIGRCSLPPGQWWMLGWGRQGPNRCVPVPIRRRTGCQVWEVRGGA